MPTEHDERTSVHAIFNFIGFVALTGNVALSLYHMRWNATHENVEANIVGKPLYIISFLMFAHWAIRFWSFAVSFSVIAKDARYMRIMEWNKLFGVSVIWLQAEFLIFLLALAEGWIAGTVMNMFPTELIALLLLCSVVAIFTTLNIYSVTNVQVRSE